LNCYEGIYFIHFCFALLAFLLVLGLHGFYQLLQFDFNPFNQLPFSIPSEKFNLKKGCVKLVSLVYLIADTNGDLNIAFLVLYTIAWGFLIT